MLLHPENTFEPEALWTPGTPLPPLATGEAHFWLGPVDVPEHRISEWAGLLPQVESARASRFHFPADRRRYLVSHALLRLLLGAYLNEAPQALRFTENPFGKPALEDALQRGQIEFNLSHSGDMAAIGFCRGQAVGVDVEKARAGVHFKEIATTVCTSRELATLESLADRAQAEAFLDCWTRKEAYIKARGEGLSHPLQDFEVDIGSARTFQVSDSNTGRTLAAGWATRATCESQIYPAAMIVLGKTPRVRQFSWRIEVLSFLSPGLT